jgi:hypothetical protein
LREKFFSGLSGPGGDLLSRALRRSTIGAEGFHGRVRDGIGCLSPRCGHQAGEDQLCVECLLGWAVAAARGGPAASEAGRIKVFCRAIRTGQLSRLPCVHLRPIDVVVFHGSSARPGLEGGFPLRCLQRLSRPHIATRRCGWRHNRCTRGASIPVLSY